MKLNMGCGFLHKEGYVNADYSKICKPDQVVDFESLPYPWEDNTFDTIYAKDILEHLGNTPKEFINILKEMVRISKDKADWTVIAPHWHCDNAVDDPTHVRFITRNTFKMFDQSVNVRWINEKMSNSTLGLYNEIDLEVKDVKYDIMPYWIEKIKNGEIGQREVDLKLSFENNICLDFTTFIRVHKPGRQAAWIEERLKNG